MEDLKRGSSPVEESRREVVKKLAYAAPIVLSLAVSPAFASSGSSGTPSCHRGTKSHSGSNPSVNN